MRLLIAALAACWLAGCSSRLVTNTPRSAIEQLLLSGAVDRALAKADLPQLKGRKVWPNFANLKAYDQDYVKSATRARLLQLGARLVEKPGDADLIVEVACGGLGVEYKTSLIGVPAISIPNTPMPTPELALYKSTEQTGIVKLLFLIYADGKLVLTARYYAKCDRKENYLLGFRFQSKDDIRKGWEEAETPSDAESSAGR